MSKKVSSKGRTVPSKRLKSHLKSRADSFDLFKQKKEQQSYLDAWKSDNLPNPFDVTKKFIQEKGLKIYGGLALHELLSKKKAPIYDKSEFPDYDVFSPNAWEHAKELCDILYNMGFYFVDVRSSIINNEKHATYKVSVDMIYILDLTQSGCTSLQLKDQDCKKCGMSKDKKCISVYNNIPCYNLLEKSEKEYTRVFDYKNDKSLYPKKLFVCSPDWMKISMYRELTEPLDNPGRLEKVASRLEMFTNKYPYVANKCELYDADKKTNTSQEKHRILFANVLKFLEKHLDEKNFINHGIRAYNFFINGHKNAKKAPLNYHEVYTQYPDINDFNEILNVLHRKFKNFKFKIQKNLQYWKEVDVLDYIIFGKENKKNSRYHKLVVFTFNTECLPYIQYRGTKYVTHDRMKYHYFRNVALNNVMKNIEKYPVNHACLLDNLINVENSVKKKYPLLDKGKHRRFVLKCEGELLNKLKTSLFKRFRNKIELTKDSLYTLEEPKKGMITKTYPVPDGSTKLPYVPPERALKNYRKYSKKSGRYVKQKSYVKNEKNYLFNNANTL
jgi:hypothetical protein